LTGLTGLTGLAWLLGSRCLSRLLLLGESRLGLSNLLLKVVLLEVAAELEVVDTLLQADQYVVQLHVELSALVEKLLQLLLHDDGLIYFLEESALGRIVTGGVDSLHHGGSLLLDAHCDLLLLLLEGLILVVVLGELGPVALEDLVLLSLILVHLHEVLHYGKVVKHGNAIVHHFLFALSDGLELGEQLLDTIDGRVALDLSAGSGLRDHG
jgi:hypothetical protein